MARIERLKSGTYRIRVCIGKDLSGKYRYKSFTHDDKKTLRKIASNYLDNHREYHPSVTVGELLDTYLHDKSATLSPGTIRGYKSILDTLTSRYGRFCASDAEDLTKRSMQLLVRDMRVAGMSPKTIRNYIGFIRSALTSAEYHVPIVALPRRTKPEYHIPSQEDIRRIAEAAKNTDMEVPLTLAVLGLRRGEICALQLDDLDGNTLHIRHAVVYDHNGNLITKDPKTPSSVRSIQIPEKTAQIIQAQGYVTELTPRQLSRRFVKLLRSTDVEPFRFHDLRHFFVSYCHTVLRLSDAQIQALGGWPSSHVMNEFYRQTMNHQQAAMVVANKISSII